MTLSLDTAYRSFGGEVEASSTPTICRLPDSRRHQLSAIALRQVAKTTDDFEARRFAEDLYYRLEGKARRGEPINSPTFRRVFTEWAKVPVAEQVIRTARYVNGNVRRVELWALQYFDGITIDKVTEDKLADYVDWRLSQPRRPAIVTLKNERTAIRQLLKFAKRRGYINDVPEFAIKSGRINARPDIPEAEWQRLVRFLPGYVDLAQD